MKGVTAKFFKDGDQHMVEITIVGDKTSSSFQKVTPVHIARYEKEWEAYSNGLELVDYGGTPLTDVPGISPQHVLNFKLHGVHNAEMLAELPDIACNNLGKGIHASRKAAKNLIEANKSKANSDENEQLKKRLAALEAANAASTGKSGQGSRAA